MKNIYLIQTDKGSKLTIRKSDSKLLFSKDYFNTELGGNQHIYITSDEEIKDVRLHKGKWHLEKGNILNKFPNYLTDLSECKLVIMTTDQDLIKDGVQAIDDEFLEWFVKNHTCKFVEVKQLLSNNGNAFFGYKIIIPKEDTKQETLEEAAERLYPTTINSFTDSGFDMSETERLIFINGAKWQQEQIKNMYSEEEVRKMFSKYNEVIAHRDIEEWQPWIDKQFKKNKWKKY